ncbi:MAG: glycosyltransferase [Planctomycetes bacterium]|nr:glycosyltransferase [Planctomycetota bacterium]
MRVLFIHPRYPNQFVPVARELARRGHRPSVLVADEPPAGSVPEGVEVLRFQADGGETATGHWLGHAFETRVRIGKGVLDALRGLCDGAGRFDAAVGHAGFGTTLFLREALRCPVVAYQELPGFHAAQARPEFPLAPDQRLQASAYEALSCHATLAADLTVVPSGHARLLFPPELRSRIRVVAEGFPLPPRLPRREARRSALGIADERGVLGFFGRTLEAVRGFDRYLQAAARVRGARPDTLVLAVGDEATIYGNEGNHLGAGGYTAWALGRAGLRRQEVLFRPQLPREDFLAHLAATDVALFPTFEGAANWGVFEAMAAGVAVVASDRAYLPELIQDGVDGLLCDPRDVDGLARRALDLLGDPARREALGESARRRIAERHSVERSTDLYLEVLEEARSAGPAAGPAAPPPIPIALDVELATPCNAACVMCPREAITRPSDLMTLDLALRLAAQIGSYARAFPERPLTIFLAGMGEPLLNPHAEAFVRAVKAEVPSAQVRLVTNGARLGRERLDALMAAGLDHVNVSFNGTDGEAYRRIMGGLERDVVLPRVEDAIARWPGRVGVSCVLVGELSGREEEVRAFWRERGVEPLLVATHSRGGHLDDPAVHRPRPPRTDAAPGCRIFSLSNFVAHDGKVLSCCHDLRGENVVADLAAGDDLLDVLDRKAEVARRGTWYPLCASCDDEGRYA